MSRIDTTAVEPGVELKKERGYREEVQVMGEQLLATVKEALHEGRSAPSYLAFMLHLSTVYRILWRE